MTATPIDTSNTPAAAPETVAERYSPIILFSTAVSIHALEIIRCAAALSFGAGPRDFFMQRLDEEFAALNVAWRTFKETSDPTGRVS